MSKIIAVLISLMLIIGCSGGGASSGGSGPSLDSGGSVGLGESGSGGGIPGAYNPEPATLALLGVGLAGIAITTLRKKKKG